MVVTSAAFLSLGGTTEYSSTNEKFTTSKQKWYHLVCIHIYVVYLFMGISFGHLLIVVLVVLILFGAGKLPSVMSDIAKGIKSFKDGLKDKNDEG
jgi:sec-independent protein translocase protein TatA